MRAAAGQVSSRTRAARAGADPLSFGFMDRVLPSILSDERLTPDPVFQPLHSEFCFTIDIAAS
ncbi:MAG TPA: hypothetical protein VGE37_02595, partial [Archangium sp.]